MVVNARSLNIGSDDDLADRDFDEHVEVLQGLLEPLVQKQLEAWHQNYHQQFQEKVLLALSQIQSRPCGTAQSVANTDDELPLQASIELCRSRSLIATPRTPAQSASHPPSSAATMPPRRRAESEDQVEKRSSIASLSQPALAGRTRSRNSAARLLPDGGVREQTSRSSVASGRSRSPTFLPPELPGAAQDVVQAGPSDRSVDGRRKSRVPTDRMSSMQAIDRLSHVCILNTESVNHVEAEALEDELGCRLILAMGRVVYVLLGLMACCGTIPLIYLQTMGYMCSTSFGFAIASNSLYNLLAISCGWCLRRALKSEDLQLAFSKLSRFVNDIELDWQWKLLSSKERWRYFPAWLLLFACGIATCALDVWIVLGTCDGAGESPIHSEVVVVVAACTFISFTVSSGMVMLLAYVQSNLLLGLDQILDCWVGDIVNTADFIPGVRSWNSIQALLKSASRELATSFVSLQVCGSLGLMIWLTGSLTFLWRSQPAALPLAVEVASSLPLTFLFLVATRLCAHGAALTEKCRNMPALVNQIPGPSGSIDVNRQYLVRFITDSAAGFIVKGVTLTQSIFLRQVYFLGTLFSGLLGVLIRIYL
eukprot:s657_g3.t1